MAMAPKKKFDFFNGGRGIDLNIYMEDKSPPTPPPQYHQEREEVPHDPYINSEWGRYPPGGPLPCGRTSSSPPPLLQSMHPPHPEYVTEYPEPTLSGNQSPTGYSDNSQGYHSPGGYAPPSPVNMNPMGTPAAPDGPIPQDPVPCWSMSDDDDSRRKKKRHQRCRLCANHGVYVEVKGHKWYCPYREAHNCEKCEITRKRQYYMAEQQKLTREQQQQQQQIQPNRCNSNRGLCVTGPTIAAAISEVPAAAPAPGGKVHPAGPHPRDFPRLDELVRETANIINEDLFEMINQVVRPRAKQ